MLTLSQCRACKSSNVEFVWECPSLVSDSAPACRYYTCKDCGTFMDASPTGPDYEPGTLPSNWNPDHDHHIRFYVEVGAGLSAIVRGVDLLRQCKPPQAGNPQYRYLDIGAGFGYSVSVAEAFGWDAVGVEPSSNGRAGEMLLGVKLLPAYLEDTDLPKSSFDFIYSSEVIEHVENVDRFVESAGRYLKPDGVLYLTTPNGEVLAGKEATEQEWYEALSPGYHLTMLSPKGMRALLERHGFQNIHFFFQNGSSRKRQLVVLASRKASDLVGNPTQIWDQQNPQQLAREFLERQVAQLQTKRIRGSVLLGAQFRLFEILVNTGDHAEAQRVMKELDESLEKAGYSEPVFAHARPTTDFDTYLSQVPSFAGLYAYYKGFLYLNGLADYTLAERWFSTATHLFQIENGLRYFFRKHMRERALFHRALARKYSSIRDLEELLALSNTLPDDLLVEVHSQLARPIRGEAPRTWPTSSRQAAQKSWTYRIMRRVARFPLMNRLAHWVLRKKKVA